MVLGACYSHIEQTAFLLHLAQRVLRTLVGEKFLLKPHYEHRREFKSLCRVYCHQRHMIAVILILGIEIGYKRDLGEEVGKPVICAPLFTTHVYKIGDATHELLHILLTRLALDTAVAIVFHEQPAFLQHQTCRINGILALGITGKAFYHGCKELQFCKSTL